MKRIKSLSPYIPIVVLVSLSYWGIIVGKYLLLDRDLFWFFYQNSDYLAKSLLAGKIPLWNPYTYNGEPFFAQAQPGVLYPLHWLYLLIPVDDLFSRLLILHVALIGIFTAMLVRELGGGRTAATVGGIAIAFSGITTSLITLQSSLFAMAWLPFATWSLIRALRRNSFSYALLSGLACSMMVFVGGIEVLVMTLLVSAAIAFFPGLFPMGETSLRIGKRLILFCAALISLTLISAVQTIPLYELTRYSYRTAGVDVSEALTWSLHPKEWLYLVIPDVFRHGKEFYWSEQNWLRTIYVGVVPLLLALVFVLRSRRKGIGIVAICTGCILLATGGYLPLYSSVINWMPVLRSIRYPSKFLMIFGFLIALAAALGWDRLHVKADERPGWKHLHRLFLTLSIVLALLLFLTEVLNDSIQQWFGGMAEERGLELLPEGFLHNVMRFLTLSSLASLAIFVSLKGGKPGKIGRGAIPLLLILDLMGAMPYTTYFHPRQILDVVPEKMTDLKSNHGLFRVFSHVRIWDRKFPSVNDVLTNGTNLFMPNSTMRYRLYDSQGYKVLTLSRVNQVVNSILLSKDPDRSRLVDLLNIRYIIWPTELSSPDYRLIESSDSLYYYENEGVLERAFLAETYRVCSSGVEYQKIMEDQGFDPHQLVLLDEPPTPPLDRYVPENVENDNSDRVKIMTYEPERVVIQVESSRPQFLVLSDAYFPGWKATVNDRDTRVFRGDYALRAVPVEPGESTVEFRYEPTSVMIGAWISAGSIVFFLVLLAAGFVSRLASAGFLSKRDHLPELLRIKARSANQ